MDSFFPDAMQCVRWETRPPYTEGIEFSMQFGLRDSVRRDYLWETFRFAKYLRDLNTERGFSDH